MRTPRIYTDQVLGTDQCVVLEERASHHLSKVLRHREGDALILFNGDGHQYPARIDAIEKKHVSATIKAMESPRRESPLQIHLGIGISKGDRMDWVVQKATELGVASITPLLAERTEFKLKGDRQEKKLQHWRQVIVSACEQCGRNVLPPLAAPVTPTQWLTSVSADIRLVLHHRSKGGLPAAQSIGSAALLVGPEGGLTPEEIASAEHHGCQSMALGPRVLRTETAPVAAIAILQSLHGDM